MFDIFFEKRLGHNLWTGLVPSTNFVRHFLRGWDIIWGPAQDRPLRSADLAGSDYYFMYLEAIIIFALRHNYYFMRFSAILRTLVRFLFYALRRDYYFMRVSAILCFSNFRHWQASTPIGVVLKRRGRLRACSQRLPRHFNTIAPLGAEACQWLFSLNCLHLGGNKSAKTQNCLHL